MNEQMIEWTIRLGAAVVAGAIVGVEREIRGKAAGLKTHVLITMGACLFMVVSIMVGQSKFLDGDIRYISDPGRIAAQVVSGIGFIGAGVVMFSRNMILGITTAAAIWVCAGIGMVIGLGYEFFGLGIAVSVTLLMVGLNTIEKLWLPKRKHFPPGDDK